MSLALNGTTGIVSANIQDGTIVGADIADGTITANKLDPSALVITYPMLSTSATESNNVAKRTAKAWVNFNGTGTPAIRSSFNVSSITDHGIGDYTINYSSPLSSADYVIAGAARPVLDHGAMLNLDYVSSPAIGSCRVRTITSANAFIDPVFVFFIAIN